ncbi:MAG TPA: hypothetical protein VHG91_09950 [Longimicrobium sp.]|nr:hypothetical protein [Longimicrobium sp.]
MIYQFPHDAAFLPRTKLSYVNLPGILSDGKRDRAGRVSGFVCIQLGERGYLVFLRDGEPFHAARLQPGSRGPAALSEVLRIVATESERGEGGQIGYFGASDAQLQAMLATLLEPPLAWDGADPSRPDQLFPALRERRFGGVLELFDGDRFHYLAFEDGAFRAGWFTDRDPGTAVGDFLRVLWERTPGKLQATLYPALPALPVQAGPGFVDLYRRIVGGILRELTPALGRETALSLLRRGQAVAALEHPSAGAFRITEEGRVSGDPVATPEQLTAAVAAWVTEVLITASDHHGVDPAAVVERTARDSRFVLSEHGFFARLPWALAL